MSKEQTEPKQRLIRFAVLIAILLLAMYAFFDLTKRLDEAKQSKDAAATPEAEITD
ncbi:MAG: hypothetical protein O3A95_00030 [Planctomycetota bacterium]|nr:hypothetical protein [Planctomycetota bacterium]MDA1112676.1 hypothetical protein [Planctomycetota bacterium]